MKLFDLNIKLAESERLRKNLEFKLNLKVEQTQNEKYCGENLKQTDKMQGEVTLEWMCC